MLSPILYTGHPDDRLPWSAIQTDSAGNVRGARGMLNARLVIFPYEFTRVGVRDSHEIDPITAV